MSETQRVSGMVLQSWSDRRGDKSQGVATQANYSHNTQRSSQSAQFEHYDPEFAMDTAFYTRVGFTSGWGYADYNIDPDKTKYPWVHRISPFTFLQRANDRIQRGDELTSVTGVRIAFTRQGFFRIDGTFGQEPWAGHEYPVRRLRTFGYVQLFRWLQANGSFVNGTAIYYDPDNPFAGRDHSLNVGLTLQPTGRFTEDVWYTHEVFHRADDGRLVYDLDIINTPYDVSVHAVRLHPRHAAVRQLTRPGTDRFSRVLRDAPGVGVVCGLRIARSSGGRIWMAPGRTASAPTSRRGAGCSSKRRISTASEAALHGWRQPC